MSHLNHPPLREVHVLNSVILTSHSDSVPTLHSHDKSQQFRGHGKLNMFRLVIIKAGTVFHCVQALLCKPGLWSRYTKAPTPTPTSRF
jgi:hypothetical protein